MNSVQQITLSQQLAISLIALLLSAAPTFGQRLGKVVFLKGNEVNTAKDDGSDIKVLTSDSVPKSDPVWSPDGEKIAYLVPGTQSSDPKTHAKITIIHSTGSPQMVIPVLSTESDGTIVEGMRFVERFGWFGNDAVFAMGTLNPRLAEYRVLDVNSSKLIKSYFGYEFATCASQAQVAYVAESQGSGEKGVHIELQGTPVYSAPPGGALRDLRWSTDCHRLAFFQHEKGNKALVVLRAAEHSLKVERSLPIRKESTDMTITPLANSFLVSSDAVSLAYNLDRRSLRPAPEIMNELQRQQQNREILIRHLGGSSPDWWKPAQQ